MKCEIDFQLLHQMEEDICEPYPRIVSREFQACTQHILSSLQGRMQDILKGGSQQRLRSSRVTARSA